MSKKYMFNGQVFEVKERSVEALLATSCLICDEDIPVHDFDLGKVKICEKCKAAVMKMRE